MRIRFQKMGTVPVGTSDPEQVINMQDPIGWPTELRFRFEEEKLYLSLTAEDGLNSVSRTYDVELDQDATQAILSVFDLHVRRLARDQFEEFDGLELLDDISQIQLK